MTDFQKLTQSTADIIRAAEIVKIHNALLIAEQNITQTERVLAELVPRDTRIGASVGEALDSLTEAVRALRDAVVVLSSRGT